MLAAWVLVAQPVARDDEIPCYERDGITYREILRTVEPPAVVSARGPSGGCAPTCRGRNEATPARMYPPIPEGLTAFEPLCELSGTRGGCGPGQHDAFVGRTIPW